MSLMYDVVVLTLTLLACFIAYCKFRYSFWRKQGIPYLEPSIPFGTSENPFARKVHPVILLKQQFQYLKSLNYKCGGLFTFLRPTLLIVDVELIKNIMSKDFNHFMDRGITYNEKSDPLSANLFNLDGQKWRYLRAKLTPTFTSGKIKMMFPTVVACGDPLVSAAHDYAAKNVPVDIKDVLARFTTDVIGSCAFGIDCNSFKSAESEFRKYGRMVFSVNSKLDIVRSVFAIANPKLARSLGLSLIRSEPKKFFLKVVKETVGYRKENNVARNDFIQLLMNLGNEDGTDGLTIEQMAAQAFIFWFAGFETSSTVMTFCLFELSLNQDIQNKAREEINTVLKKYNGALTYDAVMEMKYLNQIVDESLRKYPPVAMVPRICVQDYQVPGTNITIRKGTRITIPVYPLHHDPEFFPEPDKFDPDRFSDTNRSQIPSYSYIPFGEGPRICIGLRFGMLQMKVGLSLLLKNFRFLVNSKTRVPLEFNKVNFILRAKGGIWLDIEKMS